MKKLFTTSHFRLFLIFFITSGQLTGQNPDSLLTGCYPFSGNANDLSGYSNHGSVNGAVLTTDRFGNANSAYEFNGSTSFIEVSNFANLNSSDEFSISFWCLVYNSIAPHAQFQLVPDDLSDRLNVSVHYDHNGIPYVFWDYGNLANGRLYVSGLQFVQQWEHYVFTSSAASNSIKFYRDGVLITQFNNHASITDKSRSLYIGGGNSLDIMHGKLDDIRIYNRELTDLDVQALYMNNIICPLQTSLSDPEFNSAVDIYPIPSSGIINLQNNFNSEINFTIYNAIGQVIENFVLQQSEKRFTTLLQSGNYLIRMEDHSGYAVRKIQIF